MNGESMTCPYCGAEWPAELEMRFCGECGSKLGALSPEITQKERRTLTVLFADLSRFTTFSEGRDPEAVEGIVGDLLAELGGVVESYGGYVDKYLGDAVMAVFGAPEAHEDDPLRAVRAALEMLDAVEAFNDDHDESLALSVGVNTGDVLWSQVGGGDYTVTGGAVNVAKRLESAAPPDTAFVPESVRERTGTQVRYTRANAVAVEGREAPVQAYRAEAALPGAGGVSDSDVSAPLVGREAELAELLDRFEATEPACLAVTGPAGLGKSRLLAAFRERLAEHPGAVDVGHCSQHADVPLEPFGDVLLARAGASRGDPDAGQRVVRTVREDLGTAYENSRRETVAELLAISVGLEVPGASVTDLPAERLREEVSAAWAAWLQARAGEGGVVLAVEDLQWADEATLALLDWLGDHLRALDDGSVAAVTLLSTLRPAGEVPDGFDTLELSPLSEADARAVAEAVLDGPAAAELPASLHEQAGGNPYFLEELLRYRLENDFIKETDAGYAPRERREASVPETLDGLLVGRIDALEPGARETLKGASVVGRRFWVGLLSDVLGRETDEPVEALSSREMVHPREESTLPEDREYALEHALLRDAAYELLPKSARTELHGAVATELAGLCEGATLPLSSRVAHHAERAGEYGTAVEWYRRAGDDAAEAYAHADAIEHYERALVLAREHGDDGTVAELQADTADVHETIGNLATAREAATEGLSVAPEGSEVACRLLGIQATARTEQSEFDGAAAAARRQRELAAETGAHNLEAEAIRQLGVIDKNRGAFDEARDHFQEALPVAADLEARRIEATIRQDLGIVADLQGEYDSARSYLTAALDIARELDAGQLEADCHNSLGIVAARQGEYDRAREHWDHSLEIQREIGDRKGQANLHNNLGLAARHQGQYGRAREHWDRSLAMYREIGDRKGQADLRNNLGLIARDRSEFDRAREYWNRSLAMYWDVGDRKGVAESCINLGHAVCRHGEYDHAREHVHEGLDIARDIGDSLREAWSLHALGEIARREGEPGEAREHYWESLDIARELGSPKEEIQALLGLGEVATDCGDYDRAGESLERALEVRDENVEPLPVARVRLASARLAAERGDIAAARERAVAVQETTAELAATYWVGRSRQLQGEIAAGTGSPAEAREHWRAALEAFTDVGAPDDALATLELLVRTCREQGDDEGAQKWLERARTLLDEAPEPVAAHHADWIDREGSDAVE
jgi:adenylate cyclase